MTIATELDVPIGRTPEAVFDELIAVQRYPEWLSASGIVGVTPLDDEPIGPGWRFRVDQRLAGQPRSLAAVVTAFEPGRRFAFRGEDREGVRVEIDTLLLSEPPVTRLRWLLRVGLPLRYRLFESMAAPQVRQAATADLENLKRRLEAVAG